jgi:phosphoribosylformimino-5-aminoimidazole carboxamide ribotide isomerase
VTGRKRQIFDVIPAIDLRGGRVVRLEEGDFGRERVYSDDPAAVATAFAAAGTGWVHVVDLDGARTGERRHGSAIVAIRRALPLTTRLQVGGGLRSAEALAAALAGGADRVVVGTAALEDEAVVRAAIDRHGADCIAVALDVRDGRAVGHGWERAGTGQPVDQALEALGKVGVTTFVVTAIERDGLLRGPALGLLERLVGLTDADVIASGGIATIDDILATRAVGCSGAIVGRALYDGRLDLTEALVAVA